MSKREDSLTKAQAKKMLYVKKGKMVHTFLNTAGLLVGADHDLKSLLKDIDNAYACRKTGEAAQAVGHGLAILPTKDCTQSDVIFVETIQKVKK